MSNLECIASIMNLLSHLTSWDDDDMYRVSVLASVLCKFFVFFFTIFRSFRLVIHSCLPVSKLLRARHSVRTDIKWKCLGAKCYIPKVIGNVCRWASATAHNKTISFICGTVFIDFRHSYCAVFCILLLQNENWIVCGIVSIAGV